LIDTPISTRPRTVAVDCCAMERVSIVATHVAQAKAVMTTRAPRRDILIVLPAGAIRTH
jgi:hypothetical protein